MKSSDIVLGILLGLVIALSLVAFVSLIPAFIIWAAWKYVAVPAFHAPALTFLQCFIATFFLGVVGNAFKRVTMPKKSNSKFE